MTIKYVTYSAGVSLSAQFARESDMLKLPEERRRWAESKGAGREERKRLPENTVKLRNSP